MKQNTQGLTLIEVLVALAIFSIIVVSVLGIMPGIYRTNGSTRDAQEANNYARSVTESFRIHWMTPTTPAAGSTDRYPAFTAGTLPTLPATPTGLTCDTPVVANKTPGVSPTTRRSVSLTCTTKQGNKKATYTVEFGRPE